MGFLLAMSVVRSRARVRLGRQDAVDGAVNRAAANGNGERNGRIEVVSYPYFNDVLKIAAEITHARSRARGDGGDDQSRRPLGERQPTRKLATA